MYDSNIAKTMKLMLNNNVVKTHGPWVNPYTVITICDICIYTESQTSNEI